MSYLNTTFSPVYYILSYETFDTSFNYTKIRFGLLNFTIKVQQIDF